MHGADTHNHEGILIHKSRVYDMLAGPFVRRSDTPILNVAEVSAGDSVLDIGTGPGYLARAAALRVGPTGRGVGLDASAEMIARATDRAARDKSGATFVHAGAQEMPFEDGEFDAVVSRLAMHHLPGDIKGLAITEVARVLKPGGRMVLADLASSTTAGMLHDLVSHKPDSSGDKANELTALAATAGLVDVTTGRVGWLMYVKARKPGL